MKTLPYEPRCLCRHLGRRPFRPSPRAGTRAIRRADVEKKRGPVGRIHWDVRTHWLSRGFLRPPPSKAQTPKRSHTGRLKSDCLQLGSKRSGCIGIVDVTLCPYHQCMPKKWYYSESLYVFSVDQVVLPMFFHALPADNIPNSTH